MAAHSPPTRTMPALDVLTYGQACQSPIVPDTLAAIECRTQQNPCSGKCSAELTNSPQSVLDDLGSDGEQLHFPELGGESGEGTCCELLSSLSLVLERCTKREAAGGDDSSQQASCSGRPSPFHGARVPTISLGDYIQRISRFSKCSNVCFVMAYSYMQRLAQADALYRPCAQSAHRLLITGVLLSAKLMDDNIYNNAYWAKIGGVPTAELSALELAMVQQLDYRLFVGEEEVAHRLRELKVMARGSPEANAGQWRAKGASH